MTLALPKSGFLQPDAQAASGEIFLADISVPPVLYEQMDLDVPPLFSRDTVVPLNVENGEAFLMID
jgi:hypothetical protein